MELINSEKVITVRIFYPFSPITDTFRTWKRRRGNSSSRWSSWLVRRFPRSKDWRPCAETEAVSYHCMTTWTRITFLIRRHSLTSPIIIISLNQQHWHYQGQTRRRRPQQKSPRYLPATAVTARYLVSWPTPNTQQVCDNWEDLWTWKFDLLIMWQSIRFVWIRVKVMHLLSFRGRHVVTGVGSLDIQRRTLSAGLGTGDRASEKLATNELKRRGSVSPDNETTTTASGQIDRWGQYCLLCLSAKISTFIYTQLLHLFHLSSVTDRPFILHLSLWFSLIRMW